MGLTPSTAAIVVDRAFTKLGHDHAYLREVNYEDKLRGHCSDNEFEQLIELIMSDDDVGLPRSGATIQAEHLDRVTLDWTYGRLISVLCQFGEELPMRPSWTYP